MIEFMALNVNSCQHHFFSHNNRLTAPPTPTMSRLIKSNNQEWPEQVVMVEKWTCRVQIGRSASLRCRTRTSWTYATPDDQIVKAGVSRVVFLTAPPAAVSELLKTAVT
jgi:hypothetical protein